MRVNMRRHTYHPHNLRRLLFWAQVTVTRDESEDEMSDDDKMSAEDETSDECKDDMSR